MAQGLGCPGCQLSQAGVTLGPGDDDVDGVCKDRPGQKSLLTGTAQPALPFGLIQEGTCLWRVRVVPADNREKLLV